MLTKMNPEAARELIEKAEMDVVEKWHMYEELAKMKFGEEQAV